MVRFAISWFLFALVIFHRVRRWGSSGSQQRLRNWRVLFSSQALSTLGKGIRLKHAVLPGDQPLTVAFHLCTQLYVSGLSEPA